MKYFASYDVDGWHNSAPYESTNKNQLLKDIREICKGEWKKGKIGRFCVEDETGSPVHIGFITLLKQISALLKAAKRLILSRRRVIVLLLTANNLAQLSESV